MMAARPVVVFPSPLQPVRCQWAHCGGWLTFEPDPMVKAQHGTQLGDLVCQLCQRSAGRVVRGPNGYERVAESEPLPRLSSMSVLQLPGDPRPAPPAPTGPRPIGSITRHRWRWRATLTINGVRRQADWDTRSEAQECLEAWRAEARREQGVGA